MKDKSAERHQVEMVPLSTRLTLKCFITAKDGTFEMVEIPFDYCQLPTSFSGVQSMTINSIHLREEDFDFNLNDITLSPKAVRKA